MEGIDDDITVRDVRISQLKAAFEESQMKLRQLRELPELSAILPSPNSTTVELATGQKSKTYKQPLAKHRKRSDSLEIIHDKLDVEAPAGEILRRRKPNQRSIASNRTEFNVQTECKQDAAVTSLRIVEVKSLRSEVDAISRANHVQGSYFHTTATNGTKVQSNVPQAFMSPYDAWSRHAYLHHSSLWLAHPYNYQHAHPHNHQYFRPFNQKIDWTSAFNYGDYTSEPPCKVTRGQWFPSDWPEEALCSHDRAMKPQAVYQPQDITKTNQVENNSSDLDCSSRQVSSYCGLPVNQTQCQYFIHGSSMIKKPRIATV